MRVCPKCGDYSADDLLAFCLADGTPLVEVDPAGDSWQKASRVIEEKRKRLNRRTRSARWTWVLAGATTILVAAVLVSRSFTVETTPPRLPVLISPSPTPFPSPSPSPSPSPVSSPPLDPSPSPSPPPSPVRDSSAAPTPVARCVDAGNREKELILAKFGPGWRQIPKSDHARLVNQHTIVGTPVPEVTLTAVAFETKPTKACSASVSAKYLWRVYKGGNPVRPPQNLAAETKKQFNCSKTGSSWHCR